MFTLQTADLPRPARARRLPRILALVTSMALAVSGAVLLPSAAQAAAGTITQLGPAYVTQTGTLPLPAVDPSTTDTIVAADDTVKWSVPFTVGTAGDHTLVATLPEFAAFEASTISLCAAGSAISADKRTATCKMTTTVPGAGSWNLAATVSGANDSSVALTVAVDGLTATSPDTIVKGSPQINLATIITTTLNISVGGVAGVGMGLAIAGYVPLDPTTGVKGREPLASSFSFVIDVSTLPASAQVSSCTGTANAAVFPLPNGTGANAVTKSGVWTCAQPGGPGTPITVTVTGADTTALRYPSLQAGGSPVEADRAYVFVNSVQIFVAATDVKPGNNTYSPKLTSFDPDSLSGQSNWAAGFAPGQAPGAPFTNGVNGSPTVVSGDPSGGFNASMTWARPDNGTLLGWPSASVQNGPLYPNQPFLLRMHYFNSNALGLSRVNSVGCMDWDAAQFTLTGNMTPVPASRQLSVEYGVGSGPADVRAATCGNFGDGAAGWYPTLADAQAAGAVNMVRYSAPEAIPTSGGSLIVGVLPMQRTATDIPNGTSLVAWESDISDGMAAPHLRMGNAVAAAGQLANTIAVADPNVKPADATDVTIVPTYTNAFEPGTPVTSDGTTLTVTLPPAVRYQLGSSTVPPSSVDIAPSGVTTLVFDLGTIGNAPSPAPVTFRILAATAVTMPQTVQLSSVIAATGNPEPVTMHTATTSFFINAPQQFGFSKSVNASTIQPGDPLVYTVAAFNTLAAAVGPYTSVDVLPFNGDVNGSTGITSVRVASVTPTAGVTVSYTTDPPAGVRTAVQGDVNTASVNWTVYAGGAFPAGVTALKTQKAVVNPGDVVATEVTLTVAGSNHAVFGNSITALAATGGTTVQAADASPVTSTLLQSSLSGTVYTDSDFSNTLTAGDIGLPGQVLTLTGYSFGANGIDEGGLGSNIPVPAGTTVTSNAQGQYTFGPIAAGKYSVSTPTPAGSISNGETVADVELASDTALTGQNIGFVETSAYPVAVNDTATLGETAPAAVDVLANDTGANLALDTTAPPAATGDVTAAYVAGKVQVTPAGHTWTAGETSYQASVDYTIVGVEGRTSTATLTVTVLKAPVAAVDAVKTGINTPVTVPVLTNDTGIALTVTAVGISTGGVASINPDGTVTFTPGPTFVGSTSFTYTVTDSAGQTAQSTVTVLVDPVPVATADSAQTGVAVPVTIPVLANDTGVGITVSAVGVSANGTAAIDPAGTVTFTPNAGFTGAATFTYTVTDEVGQTATATVTVTVVATPVAVNDTETVGFNQPAVVTVLANDTGSALSVAAVGTTADGTTAITAGNTVTFTPTPGFTGTASFTYTVTDVVGQTATATVTVTVVGGPVAVDDTALTSINTPVTVPVLANDSGSSLAVTATGTSPDGTVSNTASTVTFTPATGFIGTTTFTYTVRDSAGQTAQASVSITVDPLPTAVNDVAQSRQDTPSTITVLANDTGEALAVTATGSTPAGTVTINADNTLIFTPTAGFSGDATFTYTVTDEVGKTSTATVVVTVVRFPGAVDDAARTGEVQTVSVDVLANDMGTDLTITDVGTSPDGVATLSTGILRGSDAPTTLVAGEPEITFAPNAGFTGEASFTYTVTDVVGQESTATVRVTVTADVVPTPPTPTTPGGGTTGSTPGGGQLSVTGAGDDLPVLLAALLAGVLGLGLVLASRRPRRM